MGLVCLVVVAVAVIMAIVWTQSAPSPTAELKLAGTIVNCVFFSTDGKYLFASCTGLSADFRDPKFFAGELSVWEVATKRQVHGEMYPQRVQAIAYVDVKRLLAVAIGGTDKDGPPPPDDGKPFEIRLYSVPEMKFLGKIERDRCVHSIALSSDGQFVAAASHWDGHRAAEVALFDTVKMKQKHEFKQIRFRTPQVRFSPDGKTFAFGEYFHAEKGEKGGIPAKILQFECESGKPGNELALNRDDKPLDFDYTPDGKNMVVDCGRVSRWNLASGEESKFFDYLLSQVEERRTALSSDGKWLVIGTKQVLGRPKIPATVAIWDIETRKTIFAWQAKTPRVCFALTADKKKLAIGSDQVYLFDLPGGK